VTNYLLMDEFWLLLFKGINNYCERKSYRTVKLP